MNILIADDNGVMRNLLKFYLKGYLNFTIFEAIDGVETLKVIKSEKIDMLFLDLKMPNLDGFNVANYLRSDYPNIVTIAISANFSTENRNIFRTLGVKYFMKKPVDKKALIQIVDKITK